MVDEKNMKDAAEIPHPALPPPMYPAASPTPPNSQILPSGHSYQTQQPAPGTYYATPGQFGSTAQPQPGQQGYYHVQTASGTFTPQAQPGFYVPPQSPSHMTQQQQLSISYPPPTGGPQPQPNVVYVATPTPMTGAQFQGELFARCVRGEHDYETRHGIAGIILAIFLFPIGLICLFSDVERKCSRCGVKAPV